MYIWSNALLQAKVDFSEGGKPENPEKNPRDAHIIHDAWSDELFRVLNWNKLNH